MTHRVVATPARGVPLGAGVNERVFKLLHLDIGLATTALGLTPRELEAAADIDLVNRGAVAEQAVGQLLRLNLPSNAEPRLFWWRRDRRGSSAELDYLHAHGPRIVPVEVKAGAGGSLKSLHIFVSERDLSRALRINSAPPLVTALARTFHRLARFSRASAPDLFVGGPPSTRSGSKTGHLLDLGRADSARTPCTSFRYGAHRRKPVWNGEFPRRAARSGEKSGPDVATQTGKHASYRLLSIPAYLVELLPRLLDEMEGRWPGRAAT